MKKDSSSLLLLDVNVLVAMAWPNHQFHVAAMRTLETNTDHWATCALTQLGFVRLSSNPAAIPTAKSPAEAVSLLEAMVGDPLHVYLESLPSPVGRDSHGALEKILGYKQVTDAYLLSLARSNDATFVTFDTRLKHLAGAETRIRIPG
jgi:toxin-antitoxin system PIN domain toxin